MAKTDDQITRLILEAADHAHNETSSEPEPELTRKVEWPISCTVGPGLEGAIAGESKIGYVNGAKGWLIYRGYDIFELCAHSCFEEVAFLLLFGHTPSPPQMIAFRKKLVEAMLIPESTRRLLAHPVEKMNPMVALRMGVSLLRLRPDVGSEDNLWPGSLPPHGHRRRFNPNGKPVNWIRSCRV